MNSLSLEDWTPPCHATLKLQINDKVVRRIRANRIFQKSSSHGCYSSILQLAHVYHPTSVQTDTFTTTYTDEDGDVITISSDIEFVDAWQQFIRKEGEKQLPFRVRVELEKNIPAEECEKRREQHEHIAHPELIRREEPVVTLPASVTPFAPASAPAETPKKKDDITENMFSDSSSNEGSQRITNFIEVQYPTQSQSKKKSSCDHSDVVKQQRSKSFTPSSINIRKNGTHPKQKKGTVITPGFSLWNDDIESFSSGCCSTAQSPGHKNKGRKRLNRVYDNVQHARASSSEYGTSSPMQPRQQRKKQKKTHGKNSDLNESQLDPTILSFEPECDNDKDEVDDDDDNNNNNNDYDYVPSSDESNEEDVSLYEDDLTNQTVQTNSVTDESDSPLYVNEPSLFDYVSNFLENNTQLRPLDSEWAKRMGENVTKPKKNNYRQRAVVYSASLEHTIIFGRLFRKYLNLDLVSSITKNEYAKAIQENVQECNDKMWCFIKAESSGSRISPNKNKLRVETPPFIRMMADIICLVCGINEHKEIMLQALKNNIDDYVFENSNKANPKFTEDVTIMTSTIPQFIRNILLLHEVTLKHFFHLYDQDETKNPKYKGLEKGRPFVKRLFAANVYRDVFDGFRLVGGSPVLKFSDNKRVTYKKLLSKKGGSCHTTDLDIITGAYLGSLKKAFNHHAQQRKHIWEIKDIDNITITKRGISWKEPKGKSLFLLIKPRVRYAKDMKDIYKILTFKSFINQYKSNHDEIIDFAEYHRKNSTKTLDKLFLNPNK